MPREHTRLLQSPAEAKDSGTLCIWRDLIRHIGKQSLEEYEDGSRMLGFPTSVSTVKHEEWKMRVILTHMGLMINPQLGCSDVGKEIPEFHCAMGYCDVDDFNETKPEVFLKVRPDGVAFNKKAKVCAFLEFTRSRDSRDGTSEQPEWYTGADWSLHWAQDKDLKKNTRYTRHLEYIWWSSWKKGATWITAQYNFTVGVTGSAIEAAWEDRLSKIGVNNAKTCNVIRRQAIRKRLELSDVIS